jgi:cobalt-zinc-cadmium efflux system outer membrane protein
VGAVTLGGLFGCQVAPPPAVHPEADAALLVGASAPIVFRVDPGPVDSLDAAPDTLTLVDAVQRVLRNDPQIQAALSRVRAAMAESQQARLLPNPVLGVSLRPRRGASAIIDINLDQDLLALFLRPRIVTVADQHLRAASAEALSSALDAVAEVQLRYSGVQSLEAQMVVLEERGKLITRLLDLAKARVKRGEGIQLDVTTLDAQRVELETTFSERRLELRGERLALTRRIGQPSGAAAWRVTPWEPPTVVASGEADWIAAAAQHRPEILARRWVLAGLGDQLALTRLLPYQTASVGIQSERDVQWSVGPALSVPLPIFDNGDARRAGVRASIIEARHNLVQIQQQVVEEVRQAYAVLDSTQGTLEKVRSELIPLQERRRQQAESTYLAGQTDITPLFLAEQDLQNSRTRLVELQQKTSAAVTKLQRAVGGPGVLPSGPTSRPAATRQAATQPAATQPIIHSGNTL